MAEYLILAIMIIISVQLARLHQRALSILVRLESIELTVRKHGEKS